MHVKPSSHPAETCAGVCASRYSRAHISAEEESTGCVLSCRIYPNSDLRLNVVGAMKKNIYRSKAAPLSPTP